MVSKCGLEWMLYVVSLCWTDLKASLFSEYSVVSKNNNEISFNVNLDNLIRGLKSGQTAQEVSVKLTKKGGIAYLSLSIEMTVCLV